MRRLLPALMLVTMSLMAAPLSATAFSTFPDCNQPQTTNSAACTQKNPTDNPISGPHGVLHHATRIVAFIAGAAAIIILIIGGIRYMTSAGDASNIKSAKDTVLYALIGLAVIIVAATLISYVLQNL